MLQIIVTISAFAIASIVFFFLNISGSTFLGANEQDTATCAIWMVVSVVILAGLIALKVYKSKKDAAKEEEEPPRSNPDYE